ncbi:hypothetical protein BGX31_005647, partial [Mortierella sp. GBA43]
MEATQTFRLVGTTDILEIPCDQDDGHNIIYWQDILDTFPGAQYIKNGNVVIKRMRDTDPDRNKPQRIKHYPGVVLDVVLSTAIHTTSNPAEPSAMASSPTVADGRPKNTIEAESLADMNVMESVQMSTLVAGGHITTNAISPAASASAPGSQGLSVNIENDSKAVLTLTQVAALSQTEPLGSVSERQIVLSIHPDMQTQLSDSSSMQEWIVQAVQNGQVDRLSKQL